jgi:FkbM family methyltransferase
MSKRIGKALSALASPGYWPSLAGGVVPGVEHGAAFIGRDFSTVLDVGANKGQFAMFARYRWPRARLVCFEPLPEPQRRLAKLLGNRAEIHNVALGDYQGNAEMHLASREDSSSLLALGEAQKRLFSMVETRLFSVPVLRLDDLFETGTLSRPILLKIDVQGFEFEVLKGATGLLSEIDEVYVECSSVELYVGQRLAPDVAELLKDFGLTEAGRFNVCRDGDTEVQSDILFTRGHRHG